MGAKTGFDDLPLEVMMNIVQQTTPNRPLDPIDLNVLRGVAGSFARACGHASFWRNYLTDATFERLSAALPQHHARPAAFYAESGHTPVPSPGLAGPLSVKMPRKRAILHAAYMLARAAHGDPRHLPDRFFIDSCAANRNASRDFLQDSQSEEAWEAKTRRIASEAPRLLALSAPQARGRFAYELGILQSGSTRPIGQWLQTVAWAVSTEAAEVLPPAGSMGLQWSFCDDFQLMGALLPILPQLACALPPSLRTHQGLMRQAVRGEGLAIGLLDAPRHRALQRSLFRDAVAANPWALQYADDEVRNDAQIVALAAEQNVGVLYYASAKLRGDYSFMAPQVARHGMALEFASAELCAHPHLAHMALQVHSSPIDFIDGSLLRDRAWMLAAVTMHGHLIAEGGGYFRSSREHVLAGVANDAETLLLVAENFRNDAEVVAVAVNQRGDMLEDASDRVRGMPHIVHLAINNDPDSIRYALAPARLDLDILTHAVKGSDSVFANLDRDQIVLEEVFAIFCERVTNNASLYDACHHLFANDNDKLKRIFLANPAVNVALGDPVRDLPEVLDAWTQHLFAQDGLQLRFFNDVVRNDAAKVKVACAQNGFALAFAGSDVKHEVDVVRTAVQQNGLALLYAGALRRDRAIVAAAVAQNAMAMEYAASEVVDAPELAHARTKWTQRRLRWRYKARHAIDEMCLAKSVLAHQSGSLVAWLAHWDRSVALPRYPDDLFHHGLDKLSVAIARFYHGRDLQQQPSPVLTLHPRRLGRWLPPPLLGNDHEQWQISAAELLSPREWLAAPSAPRLSGEAAGPC